MLKPNDYVLIKTIEKINHLAEKLFIEEGQPPAHIMIDVYPRSTLQRCGILLISTKSDPGYSGEMTFGLKNLSSLDFKLELGARIANLVFSTATGDLIREYGGQWQGGRVTTDDFEKQV